MVNVNRKVTDQFYRYKMPKLIAKVSFWQLCVFWKWSLPFSNMVIVLAFVHKY